MDAAEKDALAPETRAFYYRMLEALVESGVPFLVGGAYALARYTGIERHTKDLDIFVREQEVERVLAVLGQAGCAVERTFEHWLGKASCGAEVIDVIYNSGNGIVPVDDEWFAHAVPEEVLGIPLRLIPAEEMLWAKAFVMERERYDGADVTHLLRATGDHLDWERVVRRFGPHWRVLLSHLVLFGFVYPGEGTKVPVSVLRELTGRLARELEAAPLGGAETDDGKLCRGTLISRAQYLIDVEEWGYRDARLTAEGGGMTDREVAEWTEAIATGE